ncbi:hypothetical protein OTU49_009141, partial [Cherax quadricarinatus]
AMAASRPLGRAAANFSTIIRCNTPLSTTNGPFYVGKIKDALQLSKDEWEKEFHRQKPDIGYRNLVFYARGPNASSAAVEIAHRLGFKRSRHYIGGWEDYCRQTGRPLKKLQDDGFRARSNYYTTNFNQYLF